MLCVSVAGVLFIAAIMTNIWQLAIVAAFFDWLPLPTGWMRAKKANKKAVAVHVILTLIAYGLLIAWILIKRQVYKLGFIEFWWLAVMAGSFI